MPLNKYINEYMLNIYSKTEIKFILLYFFSFERAKRLIENLPNATLYIPPGVYLTAPINLTSHMTLFLEEGAIILASDDEALWPIIPFLPSYGRGR